MESVKHAEVVVKKTVLRVKAVDKKTTSPVISAQELAH